MVKSPLQYFPIAIGDYTLKFNEKTNEFTLLEKNQGWMGYNLDTSWQATEFYIEIQQAYGVCITTGLGLGILQSHLCLKNDVSKVIVYEKSKDVIAIFHEIVKYNNFDISKLEIRNDNADLIENQNCDCLFPDHFETEPEDHIINIVKNLSINNKADIVWYWPAGFHFIKFALHKRLDVDKEAYDLWKDYTGISNLPLNLDAQSYSYLRELKKVYQNDTYGFLKHKLDILDQRNSLLNLSKKLG